MNPSPDNEQDCSTGHSLLQPSVEPSTSIGYGASPQYPPLHYTQVGPGSNQGPYISTPPTIIIAEVQPDYLAYSIFTLICCCFPFGLAALVFSVLTRQANNDRNYASARKNSSLARSFNHTALGLGIFFIIVYIIIIALYFTVFNSNKRYTYGPQFESIPRH